MFVKVNSAIKCFAVTLVLGVSGLASAQTCPLADRYTREAAIADLECGFRQNVVTNYNAQIKAVEQNLSTAPDKAKNSYNTEKRSINTKLRTAQSLANRVCGIVANKTKSATAARSKCSTTTTPGTNPGTTTPTNPTGATAYCPLGVTNLTNAAGRVSICKRGKIYNPSMGCWYVEEEYHQVKSTFDAALANPRLAILWSGQSGSSYQINFGSMLAAIPQSGCVN